ncbi:MAG: hypothetical protein KatS3mg002_1713 [Candidatus Woesearchaeota archaeon]|nr:MAG: hypothetical protein KatS3mg002_1713 [Candidatus Woesearchaeota archaeon]
MRVFMRYMILIIILGLMIQCNDFRKTPEECREEFVFNFKFMILIRPMVREDLKKDHPELTEEEIDREMQRGFIEGMMWEAVIPYLECMEDPLDCSNVGDMISRYDACILDPIFR